MKNKNLYLIPTTKPSRLHHYGLTFGGLYISKENLNWKFGRHIYITNNEEIEKDTWFLHPLNTIHKADGNLVDKTFKKIILTTDAELIADGVQAIDDDFLQWFIQNPSCEEIEVVKMLQVRWGIGWHDLPNQESGAEVDGIYRRIYKIIIPKEKSFNSIEEVDPNQEVTLEEIEKQGVLEEVVKEKIESYNNLMDEIGDYFLELKLDEFEQKTALRWSLFGAKWQQEQNKNLYNEEDILNAWELGAKEGLPLTRKKKEELFEQLKKK